MTQKPLLQVSDVSKNFGAIEAVHGVSLEVKRGEIVGFIGPNGAGKSTTMRMITGFLKPDAGEVLLDGERMTPNSIALRHNIGYLPEQGGMYADISVREFLEFIARTHRVKNIKKQLDTVATLTRCINFLDRPMDLLSKGMRQRVFFAAALIHEPALLVLDEPTDGLDPNQKHEVRLLLKKLAKTKGILISTHILDEAEAVCDRVIVVAYGKIVACETPAKLKARTGDIHTSFRKLTAEPFGKTPPKEPSKRRKKIATKKEGV